MKATIFAIALSIACTPAMSEELAIVGTGDGIDMLQVIATRFNEQEPGVVVKIPPSIGSGGGITAVGAGTAALARVARTLTEAEQARGLAYVPLAKIPSAIFVHPGAGVRNLTANQLADIYAGRIENWKEIGGADQRIRLVRREEADSTLVILRASMPGWKTLDIAERSKTAVSTQEAIETVRATPGAIGFGPYTRSLDTGTTVLTIDGRHPTAPGYPSNGVLAFVYRNDTVTPDAKKFVTFALSKPSLAVLRDFGAVPVGD